MTRNYTQDPLRIAIIGAGAVSDYHHVPGIRIDPRAQLVVICDANEALLKQRRSEWDVEHITTDAGMGVLEGTTLAKGYHQGGFGHEWAEINGSEGSAVYQLHEPNAILLGKTGTISRRSTYRLSISSPRAAHAIHLRVNRRPYFAMISSGNLSRRSSKAAMRSQVFATA